MWNWIKNLFGLGNFEYAITDDSGLHSMIRKTCKSNELPHPKHPSYKLVPNSAWVKAKLAPPRKYTLSYDKCLQRAKMVAKLFDGFAVGVVGVKTHFKGSDHALNIVVLEDGQVLFFDYLEYKFYSPAKYEVLKIWI